MAFVWRNVISPEKRTIGFDQRNKPVSEVQWNAYDHSPPGTAVEHFLEANGADNMIPLMPSWADLVEASVATARRNLRTGHLIALCIDAERRISTAYGEATFKDELQNRLRGNQTPAQDEERDRPRGRYNSLAANVEAMSLAQLQAMDPTNDRYWRRIGS